MVGFNHQPTVIAPLTDDAAQVEATDRAVGKVLDELSLLREIALR